MSKELNWEAIGNANFDDRRRKTLGVTTGKELFAKAYKELQHHEQSLVQRKEKEQVLKSALINAIVTKSPIKVMRPIENPTESLGGMSKSSDDDDGFYNTSPSSSLEAKANAKFEEVMEVIPPGIELMFKSWDKQMRQWIFKGNNGQEYGIYTDSVIIFMGNQIENPGLYGLLFNTSLIDSLGE